MTANHQGPISWYDYQPDYNDEDEIPDDVKYLRIGFLEHQRFLKGSKESVQIELGQNAFYQHPNLKQVQIFLPAVSRVGARAFYCCAGLERVEFVMKSPREESEEEQGHDIHLPSQLVSIDFEAFCDCENLRSVIGLEHATESLTEIGDSAFDGCTSLNNVDFLPSLRKLQSLGSFVFHRNTSLTIVDLSKAVCLTELQQSTFQGCTALVSVRLPPNLLRIGHWSFYCCSELKEIHIPPRLLSIGKEAFQECTKLKFIYLPSSLQQIEESCFWDCTALTQVALPSSRLPFLKTTPFKASCKSLSSLDLPNSVSRQQWPLILEHFCTESGIAKVNGGIENPKNRITIVWNFLCQNMDQLFIENNAAALSRRRPAPQLRKLANQLGCMVK